MRVEKTLIKVFLFDRSSLKFSLGVVLGLAFSISVILSTIGIMDGFLYGLKSSLKSSQGDVLILSREGFFDNSESIDEELDILQVPKDERTRLIQTEGFLVHERQSRGVVIKGIDTDSFAQVTEVELDQRLKTQSLESGVDGVVIGKSLSQDFGLSLGDQLILTFAQGSRDMRGLPSMRRFQVVQVLQHNIHEQDERYVYMDLRRLQEILNVENKFNILTFNIDHQGLTLDRNPVDYVQNIERFFPRVQQRLHWDYVVRPFWHDFSSLIEAVGAQKGMISLILQIIVVISVFNVIALIIYFNEKKAKQVFLFQALGMSRRRLSRAWLLFAILIWGVSSVVSLGFVAFFSWGLKNLAFLHLPGDVYHLGSLSLRIQLGDYFLVFGLTLAWILLVAWISFFRLRKKPILAGLREEFA